MYKLNIKHLLIENNVKSISELSKLVDISNPTLLKTYNHNAIGSVKIETLKKLCDYFNCSLSDLIEYIPDKPNKLY